jgi:hypothetical protein
VKLLFETDTIIEGHTYKQFYKYYDTKSSFTGIEYESKAHPEYLRSEGDLVYVWLDGLRKFTLLFDFGAEVGDQWEVDLPGWPIENKSKIKCTVKETGLDTINSLVLSWQMVEFYINEFYNYKDKIYRKFGPSAYAVFPWDEFYGRSDGHQLGNLAKYTDGGFEYTTSWLYACEESTYVIEESKMEQLKLFPNPVSDLLHIKNIDRISDIKIYNQIGEEVKCEMHYNQIDVSTLQSGIYFILMKGESDNKVLKFNKI